MSINSTNSKSLNKLENILIIGNGGRENSLAWAIQKNDLVKKVYLIPGNAGTQRTVSYTHLTLPTSVPV